MVHLHGGRTSSKHITAAAWGAFRDGVLPRPRIEPAFLNASLPSMKGEPGPRRPPCASSPPSFFVVAQQYEKSGDSPQWFSCSNLFRLQARDVGPAGDIHRGQLKALMDAKLCRKATRRTWGLFFFFLDEQVAWLAGARTIFEKDGLLPRGPFAVHIGGQTESKLSANRRIFSRAHI